MLTNYPGYRPLPDYLTIRESFIDGLGLFASKPISRNKIMGLTHFGSSLFTDGWARTPLGGFYNHSEKPNCTKIVVFDRVYLVSLRNIEAGEEITVTYTLYDPSPLAEKTL